MLRRYVFGEGLDEPLVWYEGAGTADRRWLIADERGSVIAVTNAVGASIATNTYDAYGVPAVGNIGRYQYTGQMWLGEAGLYFYKTRVYDPNIGRFLQTDPIGYGGGMNMYAYVGGDPINLVDPWGLSSAPICPDPNGCFTITGTRNGVDPFWFDSLLWQLQIGPYAPFDTVDFGIAGGVVPTDEVTLSLNDFSSFEECFGTTPDGAPENCFLPDPCPTDPILCSGQINADYFGIDAIAGATAGVRLSSKLLLPSVGNYLTRSSVFGKYGVLFGRGGQTGGGVFNSNPYLRIGYGWSGTGRHGADIFRIAWGQSGQPRSGHITLYQFQSRIPPGR